ncbi:NAD(P)H-binding protein [Streptomyces sp. NPDC101237]|uniref:NAD(P)H-binding protein n=1 Tax=Streptomyces sp. NPDC101237 TaxID=3366139 RepID=UPI00380BDCC4
MNIVVFGANGPTGRQVTAQALAEGHTVTAVTRRPERFPAGDARLRVAAADVFDPAAVSRAVAGHRMRAGYTGRRAGDLDVHYRRVNGDDAAVLFSGDSPYAVMVMDLTPDGDRVRGVYVVTNPARLGHVRPDEDPGQ